MIVSVLAAAAAVERPRARRHLGSRLVRTMPLATYRLRLAFWPFWRWAAAAVDGEQHAGLNLGKGAARRAAATWLRAHAAQFADEDARSGQGGAPSSELPHQHAR